MTIERPRNGSELTLRVTGRRARGLTGSVELLTIQ